MTSNAIDEVKISNLALSRVGSTQQITSFQDGSTEAAQCLIWYPQSRDALLADFPWPWAESYMNLAQVAGPEIDNQVANAQWLRTYRYPSDCLKLRRLTATPQPNSSSIPQTTGSPGFPYVVDPTKRSDGQPFPFPFAIGHDVEGRLIMTDNNGWGAGITAVYTAAVEDPTQFATDFADTLAWRLAADLAMGLSFSDEKRKYAESMYDRTIRKARATAYNESQGDAPFVRYTSEMIRARWGW